MGVSSPVNIIGPWVHFILIYDVDGTYDSQDNDKYEYLFFNYDATVWGSGCRVATTLH